MSRSADAPVVLVADDEPGLREVLQITLRRQGLAVETVANKARAVAAIEGRELPYPLVITDLVMPDGSGMDVLKAAREFNIPVVSCATIHVYGNLINDTLTEGPTRYLRTPAEIDESHAVMEGLLTPLHASKRGAEQYLQVYVDTYKVCAASYRLTGLYGPRQLGGEDHGWVANFAIRTLLGWPLNVYGTGNFSISTNADSDALPREEMWSTTRYLDTVPKLFERLRQTVGWDVHLLHDTHHRLTPIEGTPPDLFHPPRGCGYFARCPYAMRVCEGERPALDVVDPGHAARCWLHDPDAGRDV